MKIYPVGYKASLGTNFCQIQNKPLKSCPKTFNFLPKWRNFAKSGHTAST